MKALEGREVSSYSFLSSALDGVEWSTSRPDRALPPGNDLGAPWTGGWVAPEPVWTQRLRKNPLTVSSQYSVSILTELPRLPSKNT